MVTNTSFIIHFEDGHTAPAYRISPDGRAEDALAALGLSRPRPALFITGGASNMSEQDMQRTQQIMEDGIARFAAEHGLVVIDGGTESGVMRMIGSARRKHRYSFPLIGVAPFGKVTIPGTVNPNSEATLEDSHSHFVLVEADNWGDESPMIVSLTRKVTAGQYPMMGVLINGGKIARQDVLLATTQGPQSIPILVLEGSGRFADELASAFKTGKTNQAILKAIIAGGDIELVATIEGAEAIRARLAKRFGITLRGKT